MELKYANGEFIYIKKDGSPSVKPVPNKAILQHLGYPIPEGRQGGVCKQIKFIHGNIHTDNQIVVHASGNTWYGYFLLDHQKNQFWKIKEEANHLVQDNNVAIEDIYPYLIDPSDYEILPSERSMIADRWLVRSEAQYFKEQREIFKKVHYEFCNKLESAIKNGEEAAGFIEKNPKLVSKWAEGYHMYYKKAIQDDV